MRVEVRKRSARWRVVRAQGEAFIWVEGLRMKTRPERGTGRMGQLAWGSICLGDADGLVPRRFLWLVILD